MFQRYLIFTGVCNLVNIMNDFHGVHLLLSSANSFMMVVATLFRIYIGVVEGKYQFIVINNFIWMVYAVQFAINCYVCNLTVQESMRTGVLIHEVGLRNNQLTNKRLYSNNAGNRRSLNYQTDSKTYEGSCVQNEVAHFSSQLEHNRVVFNACGFFVLNNGLLQGVSGIQISRRFLVPDFRILIPVAVHRRDNNLPYHIDTILSSA